MFESCRPDTYIKRIGEALELCLFCMFIQLAINADSPSFDNRPYLQHDRNSEGNGCRKRAG